MMPYDTGDFDLDVIKRSHDIPVVADFWAAWCAPCKVLGPILEKLAQQNSENWVLVKVNTEEHPMVAARYGIKSIPNVKLFVDGAVVDQFAGSLPENQIIEWLRKAIPSKYRVQIEGAKHLLMGNELGQARDILEVVYAAEPENEQIQILMAQTFIGSDSRKALKFIEDINLGSQNFDAAQAIRTLVDLFIYETDPQLLEDHDVKDKYVAAIKQIRFNKYEEALIQFIDLVKANRYYNDESPRKVCIAIFHLLGEDHEITRKLRPAFGSALF